MKRVWDRSSAMIGTLQTQEQMVESEEHYSQLVHDEHTRLAASEEHKAFAIRELNARLAEAALREEHLCKQLQLMQQVIQRPAPLRFSQNLFWR